MRRSPKHQGHVWMAYELETFDMMLHKDVLGVCGSRELAKRLCERFSVIAGNERIEWAEHPNVPGQWHGTMFKDGKSAYVELMYCQEPIIVRIEREENESN